MFYRILKSPPGYEDPRNYIVAEYSSLDFVTNVKRLDGPQFFATIEEARKQIPVGATRLPFVPMHQFLEL